MFDRFGVTDRERERAQALFEGLAGILFRVPRQLPRRLQASQTVVRERAAAFLGKRKFFQRISEDAQTRQPVHGTPAFVALSYRDAFRFDQCQLFGNSLAIPHRFGLPSLFGGADERRRTCLKRFFSHGKRAEKHVQAASEPRCIAAGGRFRQEGVQLLFRPRPRHIKQVQRFTGVVRNGLVVCVAGGRAARSKHRQPVHMRLHGRAVHPLGKVVPRHDDDGELQPLRFVHGHDPHGV